MCRCLALHTLCFLHNLVCRHPSSIFLKTQKEHVSNGFHEKKNYYELLSITSSSLFLESLSCFLLSLSIFLIFLFSLSLQPLLPISMIFIHIYLSQDAFHRIRFCTLSALCVPFVRIKLFKRYMCVHCTLCSRKILFT